MFVRPYIQKRLSGLQYILKILLLFYGNLIARLIDSFAATVAELHVVRFRAVRRDPHKSRRLRVTQCPVLFQYAADRSHRPAHGIQLTGKDLRISLRRCQHIVRHDLLCAFLTFYCKIKKYNQHHDHRNGKRNNPLQYRRLTLILHCSLHLYPPCLP